MISNLSSKAILGSSFLALALGLGAFVGSSPANADVAIGCQTGAQAGSGNLLGCTFSNANNASTNILFSDAKAITTGTTVTGITNDASKTAFNFSSSSDTLLVNNAQGGAATIASSTDATVNQLSYFVAPNQAAFYNSTFDAYTLLDTNLQVNAVAGTGSDPAGSVTFTINALTSTGTPETFTSIAFDIFGGQNNFEFTATNGEVITNVSYTASNVNLVEVLDVKQNQITLANTPTNPPIRVSEPGSLAMLGGSLLTMGLFLRRRKQPEGAAEA